MTIKKVIRYRGRRIRYSSRNLLTLYRVFLLLPILGLLGYFVGYRWIYPMVLSKMTDWVVYVVPTIIIVGVSIFSLGMISFLMRVSIVHSGYFLRLEQRQLLARLLIDNNYYTKKQLKTSNGKTREKIKFPKVYYRARKESIFVSFQTEGNRFQEKFESIGGFLETTFHADNLQKIDEKGFVTYELVTDVYNKRISIREMVADETKVLLMKGLYWAFDKDPHLLLAGGTGGGKSFTILSLVYALCKVADIEICDPKNSDLMALGRLPMFEGKVHTGKAIPKCIKNSVDEMNRRFEYINNHPNFKMGKNYAYYGLKPRFIIVDELAAFKAELANDYQTEQEVDEYMTQDVLKGRQAGIFFIAAMQRPDGEYIKTSLRDNFMFRMSVGRLSATGYQMVFGDENKDKKFKYVEKINGQKVYGRGYVAKGGEVAREFYSPEVPEDFDFIEEFVKVGQELGYGSVSEAVKEEVSTKISKKLTDEEREVQAKLYDKQVEIDDFSQKLGL